MAAPSPCHHGESELPYALLVPLLRGLLAGRDARDVLPPPMQATVSSLVPEAASVKAASSPGAEPGLEGKALYFESLLGAIAHLCDSSQPTLLIVDDLHLADRTTADFIGYLARRVGEIRVLLVVTWRREDIREGGALFDLATSVPGSETTVLRLGRLE